MICLHNISMPGQSQPAILSFLRKNAMEPEQAVLEVRPSTTISAADMALSSSSRASFSLSCMKK